MKNYFLLIEKIQIIISRMRFYLSKINFKFTPIILYKMLIANFIQWYTFAQSLGIFIFVIFDFFTKIDTYISKKIPLWQILFLTILIIPKAIWLSIPFVIMFGIIMALSNLYQHNELIAIWTSGISYAQFTIPVVFFSVILSVSMIYFDSYVVVPSQRENTKIFKKIKQEESSDTKNIMIKSEKKNWFWHIEEFNEINNRLDKVTLFKIDENYNIVEMINCGYAIFTKEGWLLYNGKIIEWKDGVIEKQTNFNKRLSDFPDTPEVFRTSSYDIENMSIDEARNKIELLKRTNVEHRKELTNFYKKFSFPFILIVFTLFSIGVATISKAYILIIALTLSTGLAIIYYVFQFLIVDNLAYTGMISPMIGAWLTFIIFLPISLFLITKAKT